MQVRLPESEFKEIKKAAIDAGMTLDQFLRTAALREMGYLFLEDGTIKKSSDKEGKKDE